jgi:anti-anti-sigma factor
MECSFGVASRDIKSGRVFVLSGELDAATSRRLEESLIAPPGSVVVLDLSQLSFMDSSGIGAIHRARRRVITGGGTLVLSRPQPMVHRVLQITGLDDWVTDWDSEWGGPSTAELLPESVWHPPSLIAES